MAIENEEWKLSNEYKAFRLSPFTHTIKLESDMLWTTNTDWWWNHLWQHDLVFSINSRNFKDEIVKHTPYRNLFVRNHLPNIYNGLMYFRKSKWAQKFFDTAKHITEHWTDVKKNILINCHDEYPSTDVVFALAYRILDPSNKSLVDYEWFKFMHNKQHINGIGQQFDNDNFLYPLKVGNKLYMGGYRQSRIVHYHNKKLVGELNGSTP